MTGDEVHAVLGSGAQNLIQLDAKRLTALNRTNGQARNFFAAA